MNLDINVTLTADSSLLACLGQMASSLLTLVQNAGAVPPSAPAAPVASAAVPAVTPASVVAPGPMSPMATAPSAPTPAPAVPVAPTTPSPGYTLEQLSTAGANLTRADPSKMAQLVALLQQYGVQAVTQLAPEHYGAFATALRGLGAAI